MPKHNRRYKDSVFVDFFGEDKNAKANFLSLYNALHGTKLDAFVELKSLRLEQVMYMAFRNDVACLVDGKIIVLVEHQSTINANMPLRFLQYAARTPCRILAKQPRILRSKNMVVSGLSQKSVTFSTSSSMCCVKSLVTRLSQRYSNKALNSDLSSLP